MKADCILPGSLFDVASNDLFAHGIRIRGCAAVLQEPLLHFPVHTATHFCTCGSWHPLLAHNEACEQGMWRGDVQTVFASSPLLYGAHLCSQPPPIGMSTQTVIRTLFPPLPLMVGPFSNSTLAPPCSCLVDTHHISTF